MKRKLEVILQHGWGFDSKCWRSWMPHLSENPEYELSVQTPDRGYFGPAQNVEPFRGSSSIKIIVAHSLGLHFLPEELIKSADIVVLAACFVHFHDGSPLDQKRSARTVALMQKRLQEEPVELLQDFYKNTYYPLLSSRALLMRDTDRLNLDALACDLEILDQNRFETQALARVPEILLLHGSQDMIVSSKHSQSMHESLDRSNLVIFEGSGHSLPLTHAAPVWISLRNSLRNLCAAGRQDS